MVKVLGVAGSQNMPPHSRPLRHKDHFELKAVEKKQLLPHLPKKQDINLQRCPSPLSARKDRR